MLRVCWLVLIVDRCDAARIPNVTTMVDGHCHGAHIRVGGRGRAFMDAPKIHVVMDEGATGFES